MRTRTPNDADAWRRIVVREFAALKSVVLREEAVARSLRLPEGRGALLCVSELHASDRETIETLARFRAGVTTFPGTFKVTFEGTARWLRSGLLDVPDRILFLVLGRTGQVVGHLGFAHADNAARRIELDNVIRGVAGVEPGVMADAVERLLEWAETTFAPADIHLRVLDDNDHAIRFYERLGFERYGSEPLRREESNGEVRYVPLAPNDRGRPDRFYACLRLARLAAARRNPLLRSA